MSHDKEIIIFKSQKLRLYSFIVELLKIRIEPCNLEHWASASSLIMYICATVCFAACRTAAPCKLLVVAQSCAQSAQIRRVYACMHVQVCMYTCMQGSIHACMMHTYMSMHIYMHSWCIHGPCIHASVFTRNSYGRTRR